jgi:long-chain fatty acid transport protein
MRCSRQSLICLGALCIFSLPTAELLADGLVRDGIGAISSGRGGTNIAHSDNGAVMLDNPAGIVNFEGRHFVEVGIDTVITKLRYTDSENYVHNSTQPMPPPEIAYFYTSEDKSWAAGVGVFATAGFSASYMMNNATFGPDLQRYRSMGTYMKILPGFAFHVTDQLSIGASLGIGVSRVELDGPFYMQEGMLAGVPAKFDLSTLGATPIWSVGMQYELSEDTTIGLAYNSAAYFGLKGELNAQVVGLAPTPILSDFDARLAITWPQSLGAGIKHCINESNRVSVDVIWYDWASAFDNLSLRLTNPSNPMVGALVGPTLTQNIPLNWKQTVSTRLGYEFFATDVDTWRLGYVYHPAPVPSNTLNPYLDGVLVHAFSTGYSRRIDDWLLNFAYQYSFGPEREVGQSLIVGGDFDNSTFKAEAHWISVSIAKYF